MPIPTDPAAVLYLVEIDVTIGEHRYTMPVRTAADWIAATQSHHGHIAGYLPGLLTPDDRATIADLLIAGDLKRADLELAAHDLIAVATGFDWWWVGHRLMVWLVAGWTQFGPRLIRGGHRFDEEPVGNVLLGLLGMIQEHMGTQEVPQRQAFISELCMPPRELADWDELFELVGAMVLNDTAIT